MAISHILCVVSDALIKVKFCCRQKTVGASFKQRSGIYHFVHPTKNRREEAALQTCPRKTKWFIHPNQ